MEGRERLWRQARVSRVGRGQDAVHLAEAAAERSRRWPATGPSVAQRWPGASRWDRRSRKPRPPASSSGASRLGLDVVQEGLHGLARGVPEVALVGHVGLHHGQRRVASASLRVTSSEPSTGGTHAKPVLTQVAAQLEVRVRTVLQHPVELHDQAVAERGQAVRRERLLADGPGAQRRALAPRPAPSSSPARDVPRARPAPSARCRRPTTICKQGLEDARHLAAVEELRGSPAPASRATTARSASSARLSSVRRRGAWSGAPGRSPARRGGSGPPRRPRRPAGRPGMTMTSTMRAACTAWPPPRYQLPA